MTETIDLAKHPVTLSDELGSTSPFFGSLDERLRLIAEGNYRERLNDYYRGGEQRGYRPLDAATDEMEGAALCPNLRRSRGRITLMPPW